ncbi:hypothetical protein [Actibacterium lipolyticum]|uniref:Uncharacterized protein n=1 Tax=Actibacterium lipolyticum TaxID=1524263 RepID=A0A238JMM8_9RHOB|nr:hypothetical protein [Actibacterium lipolyticum]SMX31745.1 hypothetical protein COL8621_00592 [Actibacterium lipolyticum]
MNSAKSEALGARVRELVEEGLAKKGVSARRASMDVVGHDGLIRDIRAGRVPSFDRLVSLFEYLSIPVEFGKRPAVPGVSEDPPAVTTSGFATPEALRAGFLPFPWHRSARQRGMGPVAFSSGWLAQSGLIAENLSFAAPDNKQGLVALVDVAASRSGGPDLWCFVEGGQPKIGRLQWQGKDILIVTDDTPQASARVLVGPAREALQILGRVVWTGTLI